VQGGYLISPSFPLEIAASYGLIRASDVKKSSIAESNEVTGGLNYYPFNMHALKLQAEYAHIGYQTRTTTNVPDNRVRVQLQIVL
jgi:hypothetical protein